MWSEEELIEFQRYIDSEMSLQEITSFEQKMASSKDLADDTVVPPGLLTQLASTTKVRSKAQMLEVLKQVRQNTVPKSRRKFMWYALLVFVLLVVGYNIFGSKSIPPNEEVFNAYYLPYDGAIITRGTMDNDAEGINFYNAKLYDQALEAFLKTYQKDTSDAQLLILIGCSSLSLRDSKNSVKHLRKGRQLENKLLHQNLHWYLSLAYLLDNDIEKSKQALNQVISTNSSYKRQASLLLTEPVYNE